jgi:hypothetical protein
MGCDANELIQPSILSRHLQGLVEHPVPCCRFLDRYVLCSYLWVPTFVRVSYGCAITYRVILLRQFKCVMATSPSSFQVA